MIGEKEKVIYPVELILPALFNVSLLYPRKQSPGGGGIYIYK